MKEDTLGSEGRIDGPEGQMIENGGYVQRGGCKAIIKMLRAEDAGVSQGITVGGRQSGC